MSPFLEAMNRPIPRLMKSCEQYFDAISIAIRQPVLVDVNQCSWSEECWYICKQRKLLWTG